MATASLVELLGSNPYFSAGFGLLGVGTGLAILKQGAVQGGTFARRQLLVTLEIPSKDKSYQWFLRWMATHGKSARNAHQLSVETAFKQHDNGHVETTFALVPGPGRHYVKFRGAWLQVERTRERTMVDLQSGSPWETVVLTTLSRDRNVLRELLDDAKTLAIRSQEGKTVIYTAWGAEWRPFGQPRRRRALESVVLDTKVAEGIVTDVSAFVANAKWYYDRGRFIGQSCP